MFVKRQRGGHTSTNLEWYVQVYGSTRGGTMTGPAAAYKWVCQDPNHLTYRQTTFAKSQI